MQLIPACGLVAEYAVGPDFGRTPSAFKELFDAGIYEKLNTNAHIMRYIKWKAIKILEAKTYRETDRQKYNYGATYGQIY